MSNKTQDTYSVERYKTTTNDIIEVLLQDDDTWLTQKQTAQLFDVTVANINQHIKSILASGELENSVVKPHLITASDGKKYQF